MNCMHLSSKIHHNVRDLKNMEQALGTGIASELDLAYWHARYTAASRFDAGGATADPKSSSHQVVPPPEVYFVGLAFHVPTVAEVRASTVLDNSPALRRMLVDVFDLPVCDAGAQRHATGGMCQWLVFGGCCQSTGIDWSIGAMLFGQHSRSALSRIV